MRKEANKHDFVVNLTGSAEIKGLKFHQIPLTSIPPVSVAPGHLTVHRNTRHINV